MALMAYPGGWLEEMTRQINADIKQNNAEQHGEIFQRDSARYQRNSAYIKFYPNRFFSNSINPLYDLRALKRIKEAVSEFKPDLISCHSTKAGFLTRIAIRNRIPTIFTAHGWAFTKGVPILRKYPVLLAEKIASRFCSKIICVSDFDKNLALKYGIASKEKIVTIHNGVELVEWNNADKRGYHADITRNSADITQINVEIKRNNAEIKRINAEKELFRIVFVGRLAQPKEPLLLLEAFSSLPTQLKNKAQISIIGEGPERKQLERFIRKKGLAGRVRLLGSVPRERVFEVLIKSDIFVLISNWEGFPYTILEAMSAGLAVIASDVGGIKEAIGDKSGILIRRGNKKDLEEALESLLKNPLLVKIMGEKARKRIGERFSLQEMLEKTEKVYHNLSLK